MTARRRWRAWAGATLLALSPEDALAHGFGQRYDLPVPLWLWAAAAAAAVALSFAIIGLFVKASPGVQGYGRLNLLRFPLGRLLADRRIRFAVRLVSVGVLALVLAASLAGDQSPTRNIAPTFIWVAWWVGFAYVSALVGNVWAVVNPWAALFAWGEALVGSGPPRRRYPPALGVWPAVGLFLAFAWIELVYTGRSIPAQLGRLIVAYSALTWTGMALFGRATWLRYADPFATAFGVLARFAPTEIRVTDSAGLPPVRDSLRETGRHLPRLRGVLRPSHSRPPRMERAALRRGPPQHLGRVPLDGRVRPRPALDGDLRRIHRHAGVGQPGREPSTPRWRRSAKRGSRSSCTLGLIAFPLLFGLVYLGFARWMAWMGEDQLTAGTVACLFVLSLVPIAIAYHLAHYFTYLLIQGQLLIRLASDPFGFGWNLLGTARYRPDIGIVGARAVWYTAVVAIVVGHVLAVYVAHVVALREFRGRRAALRSQLPMLVLMVGYTVVSLWIIAQPIVESR